MNQSSYIVITMSQNKKETFTKLREVEESDSEDESSSNEDESSSIEDESSNKHDEILNEEDLKITEDLEKLNINKSNLKKIKDFCKKWVNDVLLESEITITKPGSVKYLLFGQEPSRQSISIKCGKLGELVVIEMIKCNPKLELLKCGIHYIDKNGKNGENKDIDLLWIDHIEKKVYYREAKGNIELDSEKLPATFKKITKNLQPYIEKKYPDYKIDVGILNWSVYARNILTKGVSHINKCEQNGVQVDHMGDLIRKIDFVWEEKDYYEYFRELGNLINTRFE